MKTINTNNSRAAIVDWQNNPAITNVVDFSKPVQEVKYPSVTVCKGRTGVKSDDAGDYIRSVFNNLHFVPQDDPEANKSINPRTNFENFLDTASQSFAELKSDWRGLAFLYPEWPPRDFGTFLSHFSHTEGAYFSEEFFDAFSAAVFGRTLSKPPDTLDFPFPGHLANLVSRSQYLSVQDTDPIYLDGVTTEQLLKLFHFPKWLKHMVQKGKFANYSSAVQEELMPYLDAGFELREDFREPTFMPLIMGCDGGCSSESLPLITHPSITDMGLCETINGQSIAETFKMDNERTRTFVSLLDTRNSSNIIPIYGSGPRYEVKFWLNVREVIWVRSSRRKRGVL